MCLVSVPALVLSCVAVGLIVYNTTAVLPHDEPRSALQPGVVISRLVCSVMSQCQWRFCSLALFAIVQSQNYPISTVPQPRAGAGAAAGQGDGRAAAHPPRAAHLQARARPLHHPGQLHHPGPRGDRWAVASIIYLKQAKF